MRLLALGHEKRVAPLNLLALQFTGEQQVFILACLVSFSKDHDTAFSFSLVGNFQQRRSRWLYIYYSSVPERAS